MSHHTVNDRIKLQASTWVSRLNRGLTDEEKPQLVAWINQNPAHYRAIHNVASFFDNIAPLKELNGIFPIDKSEQNKKSNLLFILTLSVLIITLMFMVSNWLKNTNTRTNSPVFYTSQLGKNSTFTLDDGSLITLNSNSKVKVSFSNQSRHVNLIKGEAQFDVAKDIYRPFTVTSGAKSFTALGTIFNIQKNNELDMELIVSEGEVLIAGSNIATSLLAEVIKRETAKHNSPAIITDNEQAIIINAKQKTVKSLPPQQLQQSLAWQQGMLVFHGEPLLDALKEVSRYTNVQFEITDEKINQIRIAGSYKTGDVKSLLTALESNFDISYKFNATNSVQLSKSHR